MNLAPVAEKGRGGEVGDRGPGSLARLRAQLRGLARARVSLLPVAALDVDPCLESQQVGKGAEKAEGAAHSNKVVDEPLGLNEVSCCHGGNAELLSHSKVIGSPRPVSREAIDDGRPPLH